MFETPKMVTYTILLLIVLVHWGNTQTIDQLISSAAKTSHQMDVLHDENTILVELDMLFTKEDWDLIQSVNGRLVKRTAIRYTKKRWRNKTIPYTISGSFSKYDRQQIGAAIKDWEDYTCIKFRPAKATDRNRIEMVNGAGCSSFVGMTGGAQTVTLAPGCRKKGVIIHELGHTLGFYHEHMRPDRDEYVKILFENINPKAKDNFEKYNRYIINTYNVSYDYDSIMHYGKYYFSRNRKPTILTKDTDRQDDIGNRYGHSFRNVKLANLMYGCNAHCSEKITCPGEAFLGKDCTCWCPGYPYRKCSLGKKPKECEDDFRSCPTWAANGDCTKYARFMENNCKLSCKKCEESPDENECKDSTTYCAAWTQRGYCKTWNYMKLFCKKSCGLCTSSTTTTTTTVSSPIIAAFGGCSDVSSSCPRWTHNIQCTGNHSYLRSLCRKSCGVC